MPKYKVGDVLKSRQFKDVKVLAILDDLIAYRADNGTIMWLNEELRNQYGYTLAQPARWVPEEDEGYEFIDSDGDTNFTTWSSKHWGDNERDYSKKAQIIDKGWEIYLNHSCDEWVIGNLEDAREFNSNLIAAIKYCENNF